MAKENTDSNTNDNLPSSAKKFRQSPEIEGFYRFIYENDLRVEALQILTQIIARRREEKKARNKEKAKAKKKKA